MSLIKPPFGTPLNRAHPLARGLVGCWLFNDPPGDRLWDYSGYGNHGTLMGFGAQSPTSGWGPGPHGGALWFDGVNDYVDLPNAVNIGLKDYSVIAGIRTGSATEYIGILGGNSIAPNKIIPLYLQITTGCLRTRINTSSLTASNAVPVIDNVMHQVGLSVDRDVNLIFYTDGKPNGDPVDISAHINSSLSAKLAIGNNPYQSNTFFIGLIEYVYLYFRALSAAEIAYLYHNPYCMFQALGLPAWMSPNNIPHLANYYRQMRAA